MSQCQIAAYKLLKQLSSDFVYQMAYQNIKCCVVRHNQAMLLSRRNLNIYKFILKLELLKMIVLEVKSIIITGLSERDALETFNLFYSDLLSFLI